METSITPEVRRGRKPVYVSIGVIAWNEQEAIAATLRSVLAQSLFSELAARDLACEVICVANGCTDQTTRVASEILGSVGQHPAHDYLVTRVADLPERGKTNAWNHYVHTISARESKFLFMTDADISIHRPQTMWNMLRALEEDPDALVAIDKPRKHLEFQSRKTVWDRLSLAAASMTTSANGQLCGQLYCMRAETARSIFLPRGLSACEDGLIKTLVCTDFMRGRSVPSRIRLAEGAEHTFEAYTSPTAILKNQKRQVIGQTMIHILADKYFKQLPEEERTNLAETVRERDQNDPEWLKRLVGAHLNETRHFWRLYPGLVSHRFRRLKQLPLTRRLTCLPAAAASGCAAFLASYLAYRALKQGSLQYWPKPRRAGLDQIGATGVRSAAPQ